MDWGQFVFQFSHVLLSIFWFGSVLFIDIVMLPAIESLPLPRQQEFSSLVRGRADRMMPAVGAAVIVLGVLRGTVFGDIRTTDDLSSTYGIAFLISLVAGIVTWYWSIWVIGGVISRMRALQAGAAMAAGGAAMAPGGAAMAPGGAAMAASGPPPALGQLLGTLRLYMLIQLGGFLVMFACMIVMSAQG